MSVKIGALPPLGRRHVISYSVASRGGCRLPVTALIDSCPGLTRAFQRPLVVHFSEVYAPASKRPIVRLDDRIGIAQAFVVGRARATDVEVDVRAAGVTAPQLLAGRLPEATTRSYSVAHLNRNGGGEQVVVSGAGAALVLNLDERAARDADSPGRGCGHPVVLDPGRRAQVPEDWRERGKIERVARLAVGASIGGRVAMGSTHEEPGLACRPRQIKRSQLAAAAGARAPRLPVIGA
jgi:hypothetical protein